jgi:hypothetical protein
MRRIVLLTVLVVLIVVVIRHVSIEHAKKQPEVGYQSVLRRYSEALKPGVSRDYVEHYLQANDASFYRICCVEGPGAYSDITKIGTEDAPWFCNDYNITSHFNSQLTRRDLAPPIRPGMS